MRHLRVVQALVSATLQYFYLMYMYVCMYEVCLVGNLQIGMYQNVLFYVYESFQVGRKLWQVSLKYWLVIRILYLWKRVCFMLPGLLMYKTLNRCIKTCFY